MPARKVAGVLGVFTGGHLAAHGVGAIPTLIAERGGGIQSRDGSPFAEPPWYPLATDRVRHVGEPVAIVVATTPAAAHDAAAAVAVDYAVRPLVVGAPGAVSHAVLDALAPLGVTHIDMPATPARVWQATQRAR